MELNPREAIVQALIQSGFSLIEKHSSVVDTIEGIESHVYTFQRKEGEKASSYHFRGDKLNFSRTHNEYSDFLLARRIDAAGRGEGEDAMLFGMIRVSSCCTAKSYQVFDTGTDQYYHVEDVVGHANRASRLPAIDAPKELVERVKEHYIECA